MEQRAKPRPANSGCILQHGIEDRLKLAWRRADDLQHLGCGSLLLKRFTQFIEQARVLDGDDSLRREIFYQFNLFLCEWKHLLTVDGDRADKFAYLEHWNDNQSSYASDFDGGDRQRIASQV